MNTENIETTSTLTTSIDVVKVEGKPESAPKRKREKNWFLFARSFFYISKVGCESLIKTKESAQEAILLSIIFNLKHGIEVVLKQFIVNIDDNKIQKKHDIEVIFKEACVKPKGERKDAIKKLKPFVLKYSTFEFIKSELGKSCSGFQDKSNTLFRYPENNTFVNIDYDAFLRCVDAKSKGREILKDIGDLSDIIREINKAKNN